MITPTARPNRSYRSTAHQYHRISSRANCSAIAAAHSPARITITSASSEAPATARRSSTRSASSASTSQPKLRFLESGEISPLGEPTTSRERPHVAATNRNLEDDVREGRFREDLFYRINVIRLSIKPLRERRDEIPNLVSHFVARAAKEFHKGNIEVAEETMERLILYRWPGNVRQLHNEISRMVALVEPNSVLQPDMISDEILSALPLMRSARRGQDIAVPLYDKLMPTLQRLGREMISAALRAHDGKVDAAAKALGISRKGLYLKRQRFGL